MTPTILIRLALILLTLSTSTNCIKFSDCGTSTRTTVWDARLLGCDDLDVCDLVRGTTISLDVDFYRTDSGSNNTKMSIHGKIAGVFLPFNFKQKDACHNSRLECPLQQKNHTYHAEVDVKRIYPTLNVGLRFRLMDVDSNEMIFCLLIPAKVV